MADFLVSELMKMGMMIAFGVCMSVLYDVFRVVRCIIPHNKVAVSSEDLIYWLCMIIPAFTFVVKVNDGIFRLYFIFGIFLGVFLYSVTIGKIIMLITRYVCGKMSQLFRFILKIIRKRFKIKSKSGRLEKRRRWRGKI